MMSTAKHLAKWAKLSGLIKRAGAKSCAFVAVDDSGEVFYGGDYGYRPELILAHLNEMRRNVKQYIEYRSQRLAEKENQTMAKKTKRIDRGNPTTDGEEMLLDDDAASVAVAEKPEKKAKAETKKQDANQRKTGPAATAASKRAEANAAKAGKDASKAKSKAGKVAATTKQTATSKKPKAKKSKATSKPKASSGKRPRTTVEHEAPKAGSKFTAKYKGKTHTMTVKTVKGETVYVVKGKAYKSPSSAARGVITAGQKNGWTFWGIE